MIRVERRRDGAPFTPDSRWSSKPSGQAAGYDDVEEEVKDESLTRLKQAHQVNNGKYVVKDTEFSSYPEITQRTVDKLKLKNITSLFPI